MNKKIGKGLARWKNWSYNGKIHVLLNTLLRRYFFVQGVIISLYFFYLQSISDKRCNFVKNRTFLYALSVRNSIVKG